MEVVMFEADEYKRLFITYYTLLHVIINFLFCVLLIITVYLVTQIIALSF